MRKATGTVIILLFFGLLGACAPTQRELMFERDLSEMKRRLAEQEKALAARSQTQEATQQERFDTLGRRLADQQAAQDALRVELQGLKGRLDDTGRQNKELREALALTQDDLALKVSAMERSLDELKKRVNTPPPPAQASVPPNPMEQYERGRDLVQKQQYPEGRSILQNFLEVHPKSELAANARYWIGEAYYGEKKYQDAILEFQEVLDRYADHPKAAAAMYKQGLAFSALGEKKNARAVLRKLTEDYPRSEEAKKAKERLAEWDKKK